MAAAIPATNKWLLTKQASVAPSGLGDDRHGAESRAEPSSERRRRRREESRGEGDGANPPIARPVTTAPEGRYIAYTDTSWDAEILNRRCSRPL